MEKLALYLHGRKKGDFARKIGTSPAYLSQLLSGHRRPSFDLMQKIERETGGEVGIHSWRTSEVSS
jgi:DNA-binding transcriptional regulator YdaS (Cro superfamily)